MTYSPTTLHLLVAPIAHGAPAIWTYTNTDAASAIDASGYITDGGDRGMKVGDIVLHTDTDASPVIITAHRVVTVSSTAPGAVDLTDGNTFVTGTNSD